MSKENDNIPSRVINILPLRLEHATSAPPPTAHDRRAPPARRRSKLPAPSVMERPYGDVLDNPASTDEGDYGVQTAAPVGGWARDDNRHEPLSPLHPPHRTSARGYSELSSTSPLPQSPSSRGHTSARRVEPIDTSLSPSPQPRGAANQWVPAGDGSGRGGGGGGGGRSGGLARVCDHVSLRLSAVFEHPTFNAVQSGVLSCVLESDNNVVVSAPTGSGKTGVLEMAMVRALDSSDRSSTSSSMKVIYLAPTKALCHERFTDWEKRFRPLGENASHPAQSLPCV